MFKRAMTGLGIVLGVGIVLGMSAMVALPAHASAQSAANRRTADWGSNGKVTLGFEHGHWKGDADFIGIGKGRFVVAIAQFGDLNHDGTIDDGVVSELCHFTGGRVHGHCKGTVKGGLLGTGQWEAINRAVLERIDVDGHVTSIEVLDSRDFN